MASVRLATVNTGIIDETGYTCVTRGLARGVERPASLGEARAIVQRPCDAADDRSAALTTRVGVRNIYQALQIIVRMQTHHGESGRARG